MGKQDAVAQREQLDLEAREDDRPVTMLGMIARAAADPNVNIEKMERLLQMQKEMVAEERRIAYVAAMGRVQAKLPQMVKRGEILNKSGAVQSTYARLDDIDRIVKPVLAEEGFSFSFDEEETGAHGRRYCGRMSHQAGHSEVKHITLPIDTSGSKNDVQGVGSTSAYAQRYLYKMHLSIVEQGEDTDGIHLEPIGADEAQAIQSLLEEVGGNKETFLSWAQVESIDKILKRDYARVVRALEKKRR